MSSMCIIRALYIVMMMNLVGCAGLREFTENNSSSNTYPYRLIISVHDQRMTLLRGAVPITTYQVSTAKLGVGEAFNSGRTPRGRHAIVEKIGAGVAIGTVFIDRKPTDEIIATNTPGRSPIATRILRLRGLEYKNWATFDRLIYLHGSPAEEQLGTPASGGCIRMRSTDIIKLFDLVSVGSEIIIYEEPMEVALQLVAEADARYSDLAATAKVGLLTSIRQLCRGHAYGIEGIAFNEHSAMRWCSRGADLNDPVAIALFGSLHEEGKGVAVNMIEARKIYERAASLGDSHGQFKLSRMHADGRGGAKDETLARELLLLAGRQGHLYAKELLRNESK
jgi:L,D-transpeptidase catalytic domain/Sel1 repeat